MPAAKATVKQSDLTRMLKAWKAAWDTPPAVHVQPDGTVVLLPSDGTAAPAETEMTPREKWKACRAQRN